MAAKKPNAYAAVPFTNGMNLTDPEVAADPVYAEGEKDVCRSARVAGWP